MRDENGRLGPTSAALDNSEALANAIAPRLRRTNSPIDEREARDDASPSTQTSQHSPLLWTPRNSSPKSSGSPSYRLNRQRLLGKQLPLQLGATAVLLLLLFEGYRIAHLLRSTTAVPNIPILASHDVGIYRPITPHAPFSSPVFEEHPIRRPLPSGDYSKAIFRDNLLPGERYITSQLYLGFNNQFQSIIHLLYLALKTERVAILPPLQPIHIVPESFARVSEFFDLDYLQKATGVALIEWTDIKESHSVTGNDEMYWEEIACWSSREASTKNRGQHQGTDDWSFDELGLDRVYWPLPEHLRGTEYGYLPLDGLIAFDGDPSYKLEWIKSVSEGKSNRLAPPNGSERPDDQVLCFDDTFYLVQTSHAISPSYPKSVVGPQEVYWQLGIADLDMPGWRTIGQHMHWTPAVRNETDNFLRFTLELADDAPIPAYIATHIRHGDFGAGKQVEQFIDKVSWVKQQLNESETSPYQGIGFELPVICSTDETDPSFLQHIRDQGWYLIDHEAFQTVERHDGWWPTILSSAILGGSQGFVGTHWSTFSIYSWIRVLTWTEGGVGTEV